MTKRPTRSTVLPEILGRRSELEHLRYEVAEQAYDLFSVSIAIGSGDKRHVVNSPTGNDEVGRRLRRYALSLSRFVLPTASITKRAKVAGVRPQTVKAAIRAMAQATHGYSFSDDPTDGTLNVSPLVSSLTEVMTGKSADIDPVVTALSLTGTGAFYEILKQLKSKAKEPQDHAFCEAMTNLGDSIFRTWLNRNDLRTYEGINKAKGTYERRTALRYYDMLCRQLEASAKHAVNRAGRDRRKPNGRPVDEESKPEKHDRISHIEPSEKWETLRVSKPDLTVSHTGKLGRRIVRAQEGKYPHYIDRLVTDPERRIFRRKTRSLGAVVVLDCSGSMGWSEEDIDRLIQECSGATILCYSAGRYDDEGPNAWVVARRNQRVRRLPNFPGGNGVDGPALMYAIRHLRTSSVNPLIWVSDQRVTGKHDVCSTDLRKETDAIVRKYGVHVTEDLPQTLRLVRKMQGK